MGQVKMSIKFLRKALKFGLGIPNISQVAYTGPEKIPIIETYINIANAYSFQGMNLEALDYSEKATKMAASCLEASSDRVMHILNITVIAH